MGYNRKPKKGPRPTAEYNRWYWQTLSLAPYSIVFAGQWYLPSNAADGVICTFLIFKKGDVFFAKKNFILFSVKQKLT